MKTTTTVDRLTTLIILGSILSITLVSSITLKNVYWGDPSIYLIYARNISQGNLFQFNPNQFSSGATSPAWAVILAVGFWLGNGIVLAKVISCAFTLAAVIVTQVVIQKMTRSAVLGILSMASVAYYLLLPGLMIYETSLIIILIDLLLYFNYARSLPRLACIWALIPLTRPEWTFLVVVNLIGLILLKPDLRVYIVSAFFLAMVPSAIYYGYSYASTGLFSTSSACRSYALRESFSLQNLGEYARYLQPGIPLAFALIGIAIQPFLKLDRAVAFAFAVVFSIVLLSAAYSQVLWNGSRQISFDVITEKETVEWVNSIAHSGDTILIYEVQDRYHLRDDLGLLSLDGITDGKVAHYFRDVTGFLNYYRPVYWMANDAVNYRPYLASSILRQVVQKAPTRGSSVNIDGITFTDIWDASSHPDPDFASTTHIYKLDYETH